MKLFVRTALLASSVFVVQGTVAWADCNTDCRRGPFDGTSCSYSCFLCQPEQPDGSCYNGSETWTTCGDFWGCCPSWQDSGSDYIGDGSSSYPPLCEYHSTYIRHFTDTACGGTWQACEEHTFNWGPWFSGC